MRRASAVLARDVLSLLTAVQFLSEGIVTVGHQRISGKVTGGNRAFHVECASHEQLMEMAEQVARNPKGCPYVMVFPTFKDYEPCLPWDRATTQCSACGIALSHAPDLVARDKYRRTNRGWAPSGRY